MRSALVAVLVVLASGATAQTEPDSARGPDIARGGDLVAQATELLASGDTGNANRLVRQGLDSAPDDPAWLTLRLQLQQRGVGLFGRPPFARRRIRARTARRLLDLDSTSAVAHDELGRQKLEDYLFDRDLIVVHDGFGEANATHEIVQSRGRRPGDRTAAFNRGGRYDLERLRQTFPFTGKPGMNRARDEAEAHLAAAERYGGAPFAWPLAKLYVSERDHEALLALAERIDDDLLRGAALYRLGRTPEAADAFERAVAAMSEAERLDLDDPKRVEPLASPRDRERFWARRDVRLLTDANERLTEHRTRVVEADRLYGWRGEPGRDEPRGLIYVRYGAPADRATLNQPFYPGDAHVSQGGEIMGSYRFDVWEYESGLRYVFSDPVWSGDYGIYSPSALAFSANPSATNDDYIAQDERLAREMPDASQYDTRRVPMAMLTTVFRGENGTVDLVVASGVRMEGASGAVVEVRDTVRTGVYVVRGGDRESQRETDATRLSPILSLPSGTYWASAAQVTATPGEVEIVAESGSADAAGWVRETVQVPALARGLTLSGLLLA
ncbi:MAG: GWxTD domain-containing protein, partial [Bacteroidota bacterium]